MRYSRILAAATSFAASLLPFLRHGHDPKRRVDQFAGARSGMRGDVPQPRSLNPRAKKQYWLKGIRP